MKNKQANTLDITFVDKSKKKKNNPSMLPGLAAGALGLAGGGLLGRLIQKEYPLAHIRANPFLFPELLGYTPREEHKINLVDAVRRLANTYDKSVSDIIEFNDPKLDRAANALRYTPVSGILKLKDKIRSKLDKDLQPEWHMNMSKWMMNPMIVPITTGILGSGLAYLVARNIQKRLANKKKKENQENLVDE